MIRFNEGDLVVIGQFGPIDVYAGTPAVEIHRTMPKIVTKMCDKQLGVVVHVIDDKYVVITVNGTIGVVLCAVLAKP